MKKSNGVTTSIILSRLDQARIVPFHVRMVLVTGGVTLWAAYSVTIIGFLLPSLQEAWGIRSGLSGLLGGSGMLGMAVGSVAGGRLADRIGRRKLIEIAATWMGAFLLLSAFSWNFSSLLFFRLLTGIGAGAAMPVTGTLSAEYSPSHYRGRLFVLINGFWGLGGILAAALGYFLLPDFSWRYLLGVGGLAVFMAPLIHRLLPESIRFLIEQNRFDAVLAEIRRTGLFDDGELAERVSPDDTTVTQKQPRVSIRTVKHTSIWGRPYFQRTFSLWVMWFTSNFIYQGVFIWLPSILVIGGNTLQKSLLFSLVINLGAIPATFIVAYLADRIDRRILLIIFLIMYSFSTLLFGFLGNPSSVLVWGFVLALSNAAIWGLAYPFTSELYPTQLRGTASGWSSGFGRFGGMLAPLVVGILLQWGVQTPILFAILAAAPAIAVLVLLKLKVTMTGRGLEELERATASSQD